jgi:hypothetical protein
MAVAQRSWQRDKAWADQFSRVLQHILTDAVRQAIRTHKAALLAMLTPERRIPLPQCQEQEDHREQCTECA